MQEQNIYGTMAIKIIQEQEKIIGPIAYIQAQNVPGLHVDKSHRTVTIDGDGQEAIDNLVGQYRAFFGNAAVEVCREAIGDLKYQVTTEQLPPLLK